MQTPLKSIEQLAPFATAADLIARKHDPIVSVAPGTNIFDAVRRMEETQVGLLLVLEGDKLVGVVSERDCVRAVVLRGLSARDTSVREVMTRAVHAARPDSKIPECITILHEKGIRHLPIVAGERVQGVLAVHDFMGALIERHERLLRRLEEERITMLFPDPGSY